MNDLVEFLRARLDEDQRALTELAGAMQDYGSARLLADIEFKRHLIDVCVEAQDDYYSSWLVPRFLTRLARLWSDHPDYRREEWNCGHRHDTTGQICVEPVAHDLGGHLSHPDPATPHQAVDGTRWVHHRDHIGPGLGFREWDEDISTAEQA
jgi:hypothetical protein